MIMQTLKRTDSNNLDVNHIVIVPDRASLEAERQLLASVGGSFNIRVLTFRRYANMLLPQYKYMSKQSALIALAGIIADNRNNLTCYTKGITSAGFAENMYNTISTMKYCNIRPKDLDKADLPSVVSAKLKDIALLYDKYEQLLSNGYVDSADKLRLLNQQLPNNEQTANTYYYLYDFDNFTAQELQLIQTFAKYGKGVTVACCTTNDKYKSHLYDNAMLDNLLSCANEIGIKPNIVEQIQHTNDYTRQIGDGVYNYRPPKAIECGDFVEVFEGASRVNEVYALACKVQQYVRQGGRYKDIYAVTSDLDKYYNAIVTVFDQFDIPYFCDKQVALADQPSVMAISDYLSMFRNNMQLGYVLSFAKNILVQGNSPLIYDFENYCLKYNINYNLKEFQLGKQENTYQNADTVRQKLLDIVNAVEIKAQDSARAYVDCIRKLTEQAHIWENNQAFADLQYERGQHFESKATLQAQDKLNAVLLQIEDMLGDRVMTLDQFMQIFNTAVQSVKISVLPVLNDCVVFANMAKSKKHDIKFLALLGANHAQMPIVKNDAKLLNDSNIALLRQFGINLEPLTYTENKLERFSVYQLLQEPSHKLYVSYTLTDGKDSLLPSLFVGQLYNLFTVNGKKLAKAYRADEQVYTHTQALAKLISAKRRMADRQPVKMDTYTALYEYMRDEVESYFVDKNPQTLTVSGGEKLFLSQLSTSVTKITDFYACPYKFFMRYGLKITPRQVAKLESSNLGDILHAVLELYVRTMDKDESDRDTRIKASTYFTQVMQEDFYQGLRTDTTMKNILEQLRKECQKMCVVVKQQLNTSNFVNYATELTFGMPSTDNKAVRGVEVKFSDNKFVLRGKIDRVDVCGDHFVIIDYKSGSSASNYSEKELYYGHKLQLLVYLKAVIEGLKLKPFGFYYFNMHNEFVKKGEEQPYTYNGRCLDDLQLARQLDTNLINNNASKRLHISLKKEGTITKRSNVLTAEQLDSQIEYAVQLITRAGNLMRQGYIALKPFQGKCDYCDYKDICDYGDIFVYGQRTDSDKVDSEIIDNIIKEQDNG